MLPCCSSMFQYRQREATKHRHKGSACLVWSALLFLFPTRRYFVCLRQDHRIRTCSPSTRCEERNEAMLVMLSQLAAAIRRGCLISLGFGENVSTPAWCLSGTVQHGKRAFEIPSRVCCLEREKGATARAYFPRALDEETFAKIETFLPVCSFVAWRLESKRGGLMLGSRSTT